MKKDYWDLINRPHTQLKLDIYRKYLQSWCRIFANQKYYEEVYIVDCFAGRGQYRKGNSLVDGSPLITVKIVKEAQDYFNKKPNKPKPHFKVKCRFIEKKKFYCKELKTLLKPFGGKVDFKIISRDFNEVIKDIIKEVNYKPTLFFIDPSGIKDLKKRSIMHIVQKPGAKDILLNYIQEGVVRIGGIAKKCLQKDIQNITIKELKTIKNLIDFIGPDYLKLVNKNELEILKYYVDNIIKSNNKNVKERDKLDVIAFNMPYPHKSDTIYYLLFASRNKNAIKIVKQVYAKSKERDLKGQGSLFRTKEILKLHKDFEI